MASAASSPIEGKLPTRTPTMATNTTTRTNTTTTTSMSDDDQEHDPSGTTGLLLERLQAWKHMCGYLENYVTANEKAQKIFAKEQEKILKSVSDPLKEGHHFQQSLGGVAGLFENLRSNTQGIANLHLETEKNLKGSVLPTLERLHAEIKNKSKELKSGAAKGIKLVEKARAVTQKHIELLGQQSAAVDSVGRGKMEPSNDPYVLQRQVRYRLGKQILEENNNRQDIITVQNSFMQFEVHVIETVQTAMNQFFQHISSQTERQRAMYADIIGCVQSIPPDFEWTAFQMRNDQVLIDPNAPPRSIENASFPNQDHRATKALIEGTLERKSRAILKGFNTGYYVVTPAGYLHEFKDNDDFKKDPSPEISLHLPDCVIGAIDGTKFNVKGKDVSGGKVGSAFHTTSELSFKAHTPNDAETWWRVIKDATDSSNNSVKSPISPTSPISPAGSRNVSGAQPPIYSPAEEKGKNPLGETEIGITRSNTTASHFHVAPGGTGVSGKS